MGSGMHYKPDTKVNVPHMGDISAATNAERILSKHNLKLTSYSRDGVAFYKKSETKYDGGVPVYARFHMDRKEFHLLLDQLIALDERDKKIEDLQHKFETYVSYVDRTH